MKAIVYEKYGPPDVLRLEEVEKPVPKDDEVLIKVHAASINSWDWDLLTGTRFLARPQKRVQLYCENTPAPVTTPTAGSPPHTTKTN